MFHPILAYDWAVWPGANKNPQAPTQPSELGYETYTPQFSPSIQGGSSSLTPDGNQQWTATPSLHPSINQDFSGQYQQSINQPLIPSNLVPSYNSSPQIAQTHNNYNQGLQPPSINRPQNISSLTPPLQSTSSFPQNQSQFQQSDTAQPSPQNPQQFAAIGQMALGSLAALTGLGGRGKSNQDTPSEMNFRNDRGERNFRSTSNKIVTKEFKCTKSAVKCQQEWQDLVESIESNPQFQIIKQQLSCTPAKTFSD